ncbi:MAG: hypothetical protein JWN86_3031 [Planctomycetota bacterium]|nr:hypothetical protein [Planctomycetota bacterium]
MAKKRAAGIDKECEKAIAKTAVDTRAWLSANPDHQMIESYTEYAERFYSAGAVRVWFDDIEDHGEAGSLINSMIIEVPASQPEKQELIDFFEEQLSREDSVDIGSVEEYVGDRYCQFTMYV